MTGRAWGIVALLALSGCSIGKDVPIAEQAVDGFHRQLNAGQFDAIYAASAADMKAVSPQTTLTALLGAIHRKLGLFKSGKVIGWNDNASTSGHFITLNYSAVYANGPADENFVYRMDGQQAVLAGYHINSDQLILR
ncbi:MAG TPA: hypothetical protein VK533_02750 [Sphingomonas sp.]|uniref:hypothetical protein n=1 Tax=Sphingomonas sp. TaxID=28214 RepID=UPI002C26CB91|nr:hypothetical protein [Sphingomonas sp.]HMI18443.1 hypothetical protein [Sphingomonas sp.]